VADLRLAASAFMKVDEFPSPIVHGVRPLIGDDARQSGAIATRRAMRTKPSAIGRRRHVAGSVNRIPVRAAARVAVAAAVWR
jgi:hypothetical protein